jgi:hypothetical protein
MGEAIEKPNLMDIYSLIEERGFGVDLRWNRPTVARESVNYFLLQLGVELNREYCCKKEETGESSKENQPDGTTCSVLFHWY